MLLLTRLEAEAVYDALATATSCLDGGMDGYWNEQTPWPEGKEALIIMDALLEQDDHAHLEKLLEGT